MLVELFEEARRDINRALELGDRSAAEDTAIELYKQLLKSYPDEISAELGGFIERGDYDHFFNAIQAMDLHRLGLSEADIEDRGVILEHLAVDLSGYTSMN